MSRYVAASFSWLHRAIYGREYKSHVLIIWKLQVKNTIFLPPFWTKTLDFANYVQFRNVSWESFTPSPRDFYRWISLDRSNLAPKSNESASDEESRAAWENLWSEENLITSLLGKIC